ncbi:hypothetical protein BXZ70DRAFT_668224 [Cristinia sonorae]|uniref:F-box domain-containing protein n=1 Tax=Cristinia sonorae TaxID=1940300 RepID=A0A8K0UTH6_9AGAR|nr:hypothetical protein BXZ70DRAFT_668224 [Cristinia sonorae]
MSTHLPNETLTAIFNSLQPNVLVDVLRVSHRFRLVAERILYSNISIIETIPHTSPLPHFTLCCCQTLLRRPHLQEVVRKIAIRWQTDSGPREPYMPYIEPVLRTLNSALRTLYNLESLDLALGLSGGTISSRGILNECQFPSLRSFALSGVGRGSLSPKYHPTPTPPIEWFLNATPSIQHLRLADCYEVLALQPTDLPFLNTFRGSAPTAASVLPGRPVQHVGLVGHEFVTERDLARIACSSERIRWLDLSSMSVTPLLLRDISRHLFGVECLKLKLALRHTLHHAMSGISLLVGLVHVLGRFPELHQLDLSPTNIDSIGPGNASEESQLCTMWHQGCPSLRHITFPSKVEWILEPENGWTPQPSPSPPPSR